MYILYYFTSFFFNNKILLFKYNSKATKLYNKIFVVKKTVDLYLCKKKWSRSIQYLTLFFPGWYIYIYINFLWLWVYRGYFYLPFIDPSIFITLIWIPITFPSFSHLCIAYSSLHIFLFLFPFLLWHGINRAAHYLN